MTIPIIIFWLIIILSFVAIYKYSWKNGTANGELLEKILITPLLILIFMGMPALFLRVMCEGFVHIPAEYTTTKIPLEQVQYIKLDNTFNVFLKKERIIIPNELSFNAFKEAHDKGLLNYFEHYWKDHPERKVLTIGNCRLLEIYDHKGNLILSGEKIFKHECAPNTN